MKVLAKFLCVGVLISVVAGCASNDSVYVPKVPPGVQAQLLDYFAQPDNKVFILAVDPGGDYAFGYDYGKATTKEAAKAALDMCEDGRKSLGIAGDPIVYALNDKVVYEDSVRRNANKGKKAAPAKEM
jgi:hypothetical protein